MDDAILKEGTICMAPKRWRWSMLVVGVWVFWAVHPAAGAENPPPQQQKPGSGFRINILRAEGRVVSGEQNQTQELQPRHGFRVAQPELLPLPGFYMLRMENVQKELNLTLEQLAQLTELSKAYSEQVRADQEIWKNWQQMTPEERSAKAAEQRQRHAQRVQQVREQVEKILQPQQLQTLQQIILRTHGFWVLYHPQAQENLGLTPEQKQQLAEIRQKMFDEIQEVQRKAFEKAYAVLQKEQQEKLLEEVQKRTH